MQALIPDSEQPGRVRLAIVEPPQPGEDQAVVEVAAFSPNRGETFLLERPRPGWRPGKDVAGVVVRAAADGSGPPAGARVVGHSEQGGWAEHVAVPTARLAVLPAEVPFAVAAALPLAGLTALRLARVSGSARQPHRPADRRVRRRRSLLRRIGGGPGRACHGSERLARPRPASV